MGRRSGGLRYRCGFDGWVVEGTQGVPCVLLLPVGSAMALYGRFVSWLLL